MPDPDLDADPCAKLAFAADLQRQAQDSTRRAAQIGTHLVGKLFDRSNQLLDRFQQPIVDTNRTLQTRARQIQGGISRRNNRLRGQINQALINTSYRISQTVGELRNRLNANLTPSGAPPVSFPGFQAIPGGRVAEVQGEPGGLFIRTPGGPSFERVTPAQEPGLTSGAGAELSGEPATDFSTTFRAAESPAPPLHPAPLGLEGGSLGLRAFGGLPEPGRQVPEQIPPPGIDAGLAWAVRQICSCIRAAFSARGAADISTEPNVFMFGERNDAWHRQVAQFYGADFYDVLASNSLQELIDARESTETRG